MPGPPPPNKQKPGSNPGSKSTGSSTPNGFASGSKSSAGVSSMLGMGGPPEHRGDPGAQSPSPDHHTTSLRDLTQLAVERAHIHIPTIIGSSQSPPRVDETGGRLAPAVKNDLAAKSDEASALQNAPALCTKTEDAGDPWREYTLMSEPRKPNLVPRLPLPHRTNSTPLVTSGSLSIERQSLQDIAEMLVVQQALQHEFQVRWSSMVKRDEELLSSFASLDGTKWLSKWRGNAEEPWDISNLYRKETLAPHEEKEEKDGPPPPKDIETKTLSSGSVPQIVCTIDADEALNVSENNPGSATRTDISRGRSKMSDLAEAFEKELSQEDGPKSIIPKRCVRFIRSDQFDVLIGVVIILNTFLMLVNLEFQGKEIEKKIFGGCETCGHRHAATDWCLAGEHFFTIVFVMEMVLRALADGLTFFFSLTHVVDLTIVVVSVIDLWIIVPMGDGDSSGMAVLRLARLAKLAKVFRMVRVLRAFAPLRILVTTIARSTGALMWSMTLLFVFELIGSIFLAQLLQPFVEDESESLDMRLKVFHRFGTWSRAMYTAYEITMAPGGFVQYREIIENVSPMVGVFFVLYGCTVTFAVIRVITALFLKATISACDREEFEEHQRVVKQRNEFAGKLQASIDEDGSGGIDYAEFESLTQLPQMKEWFEEAGLGSSDHNPERLFKALVDNESGEVKFHELLAALSRMAGPPNTSALMLASLETKKVLDQTSAIAESLATQSMAAARAADT